PSVTRKKETDVDKDLGGDARLFLRASSMASQRLRTPAETTERREIGKQCSHFFLSSLICPPAEAGGYSDEVLEDSCRKKMWRCCGYWRRAESTGDHPLLLEMTLAAGRRSRRAMAVSNGCGCKIVTETEVMRPAAAVSHKGSQRAVAYDALIP
ncbi:hypothetical protein GW17_00062518, partial [Ensete ventricosum]